MQIFSQGITVIPADDLWYKSLKPIMDDIRAEIGPKTPVYISFDIDAADPSVCGGTGKRKLFFPNWIFWH